MPRRNIAILPELFSNISDGTFPFLLIPPEPGSAPFNIGDRIDLFEYDPYPEVGENHIHRWVTGVLNSDLGLKSGYVVLGLTDEPQGEDA